MVYNYLAVIGFMSVLTIISYIQGETVEMTVGSEATKKARIYDVYKYFKAMN